jgi:hypothetical protein
VPLLKKYTKNLLKTVSNTQCDATQTRVNTYLINFGLNSMCEGGAGAPKHIWWPPNGRYFDYLFMSLHNFLRRS